MCQAFYLSQSAAVCSLTPCALFTCDCLSGDRSARARPEPHQLPAASCSFTAEKTLSYMHLIQSVGMFLFTLKSGKIKLWVENKLNENVPVLKKQNSFIAKKKSFSLTKGDVSCNLIKRGSRVKTLTESIIIPKKKILSQTSKHV